MKHFFQTRVLLLTLVMLSTVKLFGQNGYIKLESDSMLVGYLRHYIAIKDGHPGIELWRTKTDKEPIKIPKRKITEYAIKKDTFKVLHQFKPFPDSKTYFELVEAKLISSGKVNLYIIKNYQNANRISSYTGGIIPLIIDESLENYTFMYILEDKKAEYLKALPSKQEKLRVSLLDFFPERYIEKYSEVKEGLKYRAIPDLVKLYNSK